MNALLIALALPLALSQSGPAKSREYHWKTGTESIVDQKSERLVPNQTDSQVVPPEGTVIETWTYNIQGEDGTYLVKCHPSPVTRTDGTKVLYDMDRKTMYINMAPGSKKVQTMKLDVIKFTPK